jgi:hypothetical protein
MTLAREQMSLAASLGAGPAEAIRRASAHTKRRRSSTVTMPSAQEHAAKPDRPEMRMASRATLDLALFGVRAAGQLSLAGRYFRHLISCIVGCRMMHVLTRGGRPGKSKYSQTRTGAHPKTRDAANFGINFGPTPWMKPKPANVARKPAPESRAGVRRLRVRPGAVSMAERLAVVRQLASAMATGRAADTADRSRPHRDTRPGRITGPPRERRTPPWLTFPTSVRSYRRYGHRSDL